MARYAQCTTVDPERTHSEMRKLLHKHGATGLAIAEHSSWGGDPDRVCVAFELHRRHIRFEATLPRPDDRRYAHDAGNYRYSERPQHLRRRAWDQDVRQRWRALLLRIRARLEELEDLAEQEAADGGADMVDLTSRVFMAHIVLPGGQTLGDWASPQIEEAYRGGHVPALLPGATEAPVILLGPAKEEGSPTP